MGAFLRWTVAVSLLFALGAAPAEPARAQSDPASTPAARTPAARFDVTGIEREVAALRRFVADEGGKLSVAVMDVRSGRILAAANPKQALNPASNAKVLTAAAALKQLGPDFRYTTGIYGVIDKGVARQLVLRGHGDPSLAVADLAELARVLVEMGLERVDGDILVDQSRFDSQYVPPAFGQQPGEWASFRAPVSAIALERNTVTLHVLATEPGQPARTWYHPAGVVDSTGAVETRKVGAGQAVTWSLKPQGPRLRARLGGYLAAGLPRLRFSRRVDDPTLLPGYALKHLLETSGVTVTGRVAAGGQSEKRRLVFHESARLASLLCELGKESDNFYAEMVFKSLGDADDGKPATSAGGAKVVREWIARVGARDAATRITNGSGLFDANRVSAHTFVQALRAAYRDPAMGAEFVSQLAIGGTDGTLRWRLRKHRARRLVRAKTGTLARSDALTGYVLGPDGRDPIAFSIVINDLTDHRENRRRMDRVVSEIVTALDK